MAADSDLILYNGRIIRLGADKVVRDNEAGPHTMQANLEGKCVLPGLTDAHVHPLGAGLSEYRGGNPTPRGIWIVVPGTFPTRLREKRMPTKDVLDVDADHPVLFDAITERHPASRRVAG